MRGPHSAEESMRIRSTLRRLGESEGLRILDAF
jgi:hypothetical protein